MSRTARIDCAIWAETRGRRARAAKQIGAMACVLLAAMLPVSADAANWLMLDAVEPETAPAFRDGYFGIGVRLLDASVTWNAIPYARLRLGLFRQTLGDEAMALELRHVNLSHVTQQIVQERYFCSDGSVNGDLNLDLGPVSSFRDSGAQVFAAFTTGQCGRLQRAA